jgi:hypothetical protein
MGTRRQRIDAHFENPRQVSDGRATNAPGEIEQILRREKLDKERTQKDQAKAEGKKAVFAYIKAHPGCNVDAIRHAVGTTKGLTEWLRDGLVVKRDFGLYVV